MYALIIAEWNTATIGLECGPTYIGQSHCRILVGFHSNHVDADGCSEFRLIQYILSDSLIRNTLPQISCLAYK